MIIHGDMREVLREVLEDGADDSFDAVVTDPPYDLVSSKSGGFMGAKWDATGIAFEPETWRTVLRVVKPGAHLLAFGGTRTHHRMMVAIEDAGWDIRDCVMWIYGSGFPKSLNVGDGRGTALKPAWEPIILARKPLVGTVATNVAQHGTGAINIDACRVEGRERTESADFDASKGRWPANLIHDGSEEVLARFPVTKTGSGFRHNSGGLSTKSVAKNTDAPHVTFNEGSEGSAARFFYCAKASKSDRGENNTHPTVKPIALMRYLVRLVTPPGGLVLDPFAGSGSTGVAAKLEGVRFIGIEQHEPFAEIAKKRYAEASK